MASFSVTPIQPSGSASAGSASRNLPPPGQTNGTRALNRAVAQAVQTLNDAGYAGAGRELTFSVDQATKRPVIKVVDISTNEVIQQWPPEYALQLAAESEKFTRDSG